MNRRLKKLTGVLLLSLAVAATQIPVPDAEAESASASDFQMNNSTLVSYTGTSEDVSVPDSVTVIGPDAFSGQGQLRTVTIPAGVEEIGFGAFHECGGLASVTTPNTVTKIGNAAFSDCRALESFTIGAGVEELGDGVFAGCPALRQIIINKDNPNFVLESGGLYNADRTILYQQLSGDTRGRVRIPDSVTDIRPYAFWDCGNLKQIELGKGLTEIPPYAFSGCEGLTEMEIPSTVKSIGIKAFADCVNLKETEIPSSVKNIHATAFDGCEKLEIKANEGSAAALYASSRDISDAARAEYGDTGNTGNGGDSSVDDAPGTDDGEPEDGVQGTDGAQGDSSPEDKAAEEAPGEGEQESGETAEETGMLLGSSSVVSGKAMIFIDNSLTSVKTGNEALPPDSGEAGETVSGGDASLERPEKGGGFPKYTVVGGKLIADQAYYNRKDLTEYEIPAGVEGIGDFAFARSGLERITIPEGTAHIGYGAFYHCDKLAQVDIPSSVTRIEPSAFEKTRWLSDWRTGSLDPFLIVGDGILLAYEGDSSRVEVPEGVKQIGSGVFRDHGEIVEVSLPDSLRVVGEDAFNGASGLTRVTGGINVEKISDRAFAGCPIDTIRIPGSVKQVGLKAYDLSATDKEEGTKTVVFQGDELPAVSWEKTASRLSNGEYRDLAFKDVDIAIVNDSVNSLEGTVLAPGQSGFRGIVCSIMKQSDGTEEGVLHVLSRNSGDDSAGGKLPEKVTIYGSPYVFDNPDTYTDSQEDKTESAGQPASEPGQIQVRVESGTIASPALVSASLPGDTGSFVFTVEDSPEAAEAISSLYREFYGGKNPNSLVAYDLALWDDTGTIPITKLGRQRLTVSMPLPGTLSETNLHLVCLDANGQLEELPYRLVELQGERGLEFSAAHFSAYGLYNYVSETVQGEAQVVDGKAVFGGIVKKDDTPDTGDPIHPKWFLATGLLFAALALLLKRNR